MWWADLESLDLVGIGYVPVVSTCAVVDADEGGCDEEDKGDLDHQIAASSLGCIIEAPHRGGDHAPVVDAKVADQDDADICSEKHGDDGSREQGARDGLQLRPAVLDRHGRSGRGESSQGRSNVEFSLSLSVWGGWIDHGGEGVFASGRWQFGIMYFAAWAIFPPSPCLTSGHPQGGEMLTVQDRTREELAHPSARARKDKTRKKRRGTPPSPPPPLFFLRLSLRPGR